MWLRRLAGASFGGIALILAGCGAGGKTHSSVTTSTSRRAPSTATSPGTTTTSATQDLKTLRCPHTLALPSRGKYAGRVATIFIVEPGPTKSGCRYVTGWMAQWIKSGAAQGGFAVGPLVGIRCDEPLLINSGPLGEKYTRYDGLIHCDQVRRRAIDPQDELDNDSAGFWGYYRSAKTTGAKTANSPAAGPPIPGSTLSKAVAKHLVTSGVRADSVRCPALARKHGANVTCSVAGKSLDVGKTELHGTAQVTIQDQAGRRAEDTYQLTGPGGVGVRGKGYPFDPATGRAL